MGSRLCRKKDIAEWKAALKLGDLSDPFTSLLWSYQKLDPRLQRCFLYCSLFQKGQGYRPEELVHLWVGEVFVGSCNLSRRTLEEVGMDYFNDMVSVSFFQLVSQMHCDSYYVMHDILHDFAESLSRDDCFRLEDDNVTEIPCTVRHLSVHVQSMQKHKQIICKLYHLRTIICIDLLMDGPSDIFDGMLRNQRKLHVLSLSFYNSSKLPKSIGELKHLRYLNLIRTLVSELPTSLCTLYQLQLLWLNHMVDNLPDKLCNLRKLRHLGAYYESAHDFINKKPICQILNIGKLTSLQHIYVFSVQKKQGYELRQHDLRENIIVKADDLASKLALMWEVDSGKEVRIVLWIDYSSLKQLMKLMMDDDISKHLQIIESGLLEREDKVWMKENIIKAWLFCHEQRIRFIYGRTMEMPLVLPSGLCELSLSSCSITDEALAICLGGLT
ncbi:putative disease resistance protein [Zea mays]|uniref:Putative disease resistance protein n=1 Tax=Zea mays TaxID=4577 RepID=A0A3L6GCU1_MAIZE|nr:putative disease resistance protein [Zea mays]